MLSLWLYAILLGVACTKECAGSEAQMPLPISKSCVDLKRYGRTPENGYYPISDNHGNGYTVYCDFTSERGMAWTLVMSWSRANKDQPQFRNKPFFENAPVNQHSPNFSIYRLPVARMQALKSQSTHWRATCSFQSHHRVDYRDYVRGNFQDFDVMTMSGGTVCKKVEFIDIRGHTAVHTTVPFWQVKGNYLLHTDSSYTTAMSKCAFSASTGSIHSEDNFGYNGVINPNFRCTATPSSTTQYWFGAVA